MSEVIPISLTINGTTYTGYVSENYPIDFEQKLQISNSETKPHRQPDLGEPMEIGGHDIDRDGPVPFTT